MWVNISAQQTWKRSERAWKEIEEARLYSLTPALRAPQCRPRGALPSRPPPPPTGTARPGPTLPRCPGAVASAVIAPGAVRAETTAGH